MDEVKRKQQLLFNQTMANQASNLLPQPSGKEMYLTCSKGHTVQFCKAILQCCKTSQPSIAGPSGHLGNHLLKDRELACMLEQGWQWTIVKDVVAQQWPTMPSLIESAGNSSNSTYEATTPRWLWTFVMEGLCSTMRDMLAIFFSCMEARSRLL